MMSKTQLRSLVVVAVFVFNTIITSSALAVSKYLSNVAKIAATVLTEFQSNSSNFLLKDMKAIESSDVLCSARAVGTIEPVGASGSIEAFLSLVGIGAGNTLSCESDQGPCSSPVVTTLMNLPWSFQVRLSGITWWERLSGRAIQPLSVLLSCKTILGFIKNVCSDEPGILMTNEAGGLRAEFSEPNEAIAAPATCTISGEKEGSYAVEALITSPSGILVISE